jgi:CheY-like chemotaxis protein/two-component sensor histidine kinase
LIKQILTFSRQREQKPQLLQLEIIVKEAIKFLRASLPAQIQIEVNVGKDVPAVLADPTQIYQVTVNLATNALHAMEGRAGRLTVAVENFVADAKFLRLHPELQAVRHVRLTVADTGHGMDAATMERIFEPFFTTKPLGKGTGLGLSVVHGIVQAHHGCITVDSEVGHGATFQLYFPGQEEQVPAAPAGALRQLLERLNYRVITHNHARDSLAWCRQNPDAVDLVITDLSMPELNGIEVARALRALRPGLPIVLTSGFSADLNPALLAEAGICELLEKPVTRAALAGTVHRALAGDNGHRPVGAKGHSG